MHTGTIVEAAPGVHLVHGSDTNWVVIADGDAVTLVDTGYPGDRPRLLASLAELGHRPGDVVAVLVTHAHNDHIGSAEHLSRAHGIPVLLHPSEVPHARREFLHQIGVGTVLANAWRPGVLPWAVRVLRSGGTEHVPVTGARAFPVAGALDLPGRPVPVHTPGHTAGHCVYHLPSKGVVISGDALVCGHSTSRIRGPQLLPPMFDHERAGAVASLPTIAELDGDVLLPGHGPLYRGSVAGAAARAAEQTGGRA
ncbi:MBL fold metallo-hydrolase [Streptomyces sp. NPDC005955]|uniref:MBL fold metallo-hydrolase n=1 Tax=Streptomyces sp. NPDC005955 TaxID=3364738 RepID=UPI0036C8458F